MAEVFGVVAGGITIGGMARRLATSVLALKRLWGEASNSPETIKVLIKQLELVNTTLSYIEMGFLRLDSTVLSERTLKLNMDYCHQAVRDLELLVEDMHYQLTSTRKFKRNFAKLRVPLKKESIRNYQERLQYALQILSLSQQNYLMLLVRQSDWRTVERNTNFHEQKYSVPCLRKQNHDRSSESCAHVLFAAATPSSKTLPWRRTFIVGSFTSQILEEVTDSSSDPKCHSAQVYHARLQLPTYFVQKVWDFLVRRASHGWDISLCIWNICPYNSAVFDYAYNGSSSDILNAIESGQASLYDRDPDGRTLLHYAAFKGHLEIFRCLIHKGLRATECDSFGSTPLKSLYRAAKDFSSAVDLVRFLLNEGGLDEAIYSIFDPDYRERRETSLHRLIWAVPGLLPVIIGNLQADFVQMAPNSKFASLVWEYVDPELLLPVLRHGRVTCAADFRAFLHCSVESSLHSFAKVYFSRSPHVSRDNSKPDNDIDSETKFKHWRSLALWIFSGISKEEISKQGGAVWESLTPLFAGLIECGWTVPKSARERRFTLLRMTKTTHMWLEDVRLAGLDLLEYGRHELKLYTLNNWNLTWRWRVLALSDEDKYPLGPQLVSFTYGSRPEQWNFEWDLAVEEYVGDFWEMTDNRPLHVPGEWTDDDW